MERPSWPRARVTGMGILQQKVLRKSRTHEQARAIDKNRKAIELGHCLQPPALTRPQILST